ncbi:Ycf68 [Melia azedarach]|nr:Ycf68 [Melia azedarach]
MKPESLVIAGQPYGGEFVPGPCTQPPVTLWELAMPEVVTLTARRGVAEGRASDWSEVVTRSRRIDGAIQVRSNVDPTFYSLVGSGRSGGDHHGSSLLDNPYIPYQCMDSYLSSTGLGSASMGKKNGAPNNVSSQTKNYEIAPFISFWGDGGIVPFEPFFSCFSRRSGESCNQ